MAGNLVQGAVFTVMVVRAGLLRDAAFEQDLAEQIRRSPRFFLNAPVVLDLKDADGFSGAAGLVEAKEVLRRHTLTLVGVQNASPAQVEAASLVGLASFAPNSAQPNRRRPPEPAAAPAPQPGREAAAKTRLVTQPVRSGTQIYARGADLVVIAAVSPGAEIMADGNIHVYGASARPSARRRRRRYRGANLLQPIRGRARQHRRALSGQRTNACGGTGLSGADHAR